MRINEEDYLAHYGTPRKSGRYAWGSGGTPIRSKDFLDNVKDLKKQGLTEKQIYEGMKIKSTEFRARKSIANNERKNEQIMTAERYKAKAMSNVAIGERMGINESQVRALLSPGAKEKADILRSTADLLERQVKEKTYLDIGTGVESHLGVSRTQLNNSVAFLKEKGYEVLPVNVLQLGTGRETRMKVLCPPGTTQKEAWLNRNNIKQITEFSEDGGRSSYGILPPISVNPDRVSVRFGKDGGAQTDGVIYVRPGVPDISLGNSNYAQVRIKVGDEHYLKGMAMYKDDLPNGVDLLFNTNKEDTGNKLDAMKPLSKDADNPFGSVVDQIKRKDADGNEHVVSAMNLVNEEGSWSTWSNSIAAQTLSKQSPTLAKSQLDMTFQDRKDEFADILSLTNPTVRKKLLKDFSDSTDSAAVHLKAAALPRQGWHAILPIDSMPPLQIYAPKFNNGERVVLIRYPHGGTFEIPELVVNNRQPEAKRLLGGARDAVGIHHSVAERLSGADFDGDAVLVIPNDSGRIKTTPALKDLKNFDHRTTYRAYDGMPKMTARQKGQEMGSISNLITDMTIGGAGTDHMARAIKHSMVVIDAANHHLNYKQSAKDNNIRQLKEQYQGKSTSGASTLISRAGSKVYVPERKERTSTKGGPINLVTGRKEYEPTNKPNYKTGEPKKIRVERLAEAEDAHSLTSKIPTPMERLYADHSNKLKAMANAARLEMVRTPSLRYSSSAKKVYAEEVKTLNAKLALAVRNRPLERQAQILANTVIKTKRDENPNMDEDVLKKIKFQALEEMRTRTGARKHQIEIEQNEWDAIQAGAISNDRLDQILNKANMDTVRQLATPRQGPTMTASKIGRAKGMLADGYTRGEVASALGVSTSTLDAVTSVADEDGGE